MEFIAFLLIVIGLILLALWLYVARQGDAEFDFLVDQRSAFILDELTKDRATFSCKIPFVNKGSQDGTIMDCYPRHLMPYEYYDACHIESRLTIDSARRTDGYWEANIVFWGKGDAIVLTIVLTARNEDLGQALAALPDMPVEIVYQAVGRSDWYITKKTMIVPAAEIKAALCEAGAKQ